MGAISLGLGDWLTTERCKKVFGPYMTLAEDTGVLHWTSWRIRRNVRHGRFALRSVKKNGFRMSWKALRSLGVVGWFAHVRLTHLGDVKPGNMPTQLKKDPR